MSFRNNNLSGIPDTIGMLSSLGESSACSNLYLKKNNLQLLIITYLPRVVSSLHFTSPTWTQTEFLNLGQNNLSGTVPDTIGNMNSLGV